MDDNIKSKVRPSYEELQGYLSQTPMPQQPFDLCAEDDPWLQYNQAVEVLSKITGDDYARFLIEPKLMNGDKIVLLGTYRNKLGGIIGWIHATYFPNEDKPFSGSPQTVLSLNQDLSLSQSQSQSIKMVLDLQIRIDEEITKSKDDPKKLSFLNKVKSGLNHVKDGTDVLKLLLNTAKDFGINISDLSSLVG